MRASHFWRFAGCIFFCAMLVETASGDVPRVATREVYVEFEATHGNLVRFVDVRQGRSVVATDAPEDLWRMDYVDAQGQSRILRPQDALVFFKKGDNPNLGLYWKEFGLNESPDLTVVVEVQPERKRAAVLWGLRVEGAKGIRLHRIVFPRLAPIVREEHEVLAVPVWMGERLVNPRAVFCFPGEERRQEWETPGMLSLQCMALYAENGPGVYLQTLDARDYVKRLGVYGEGDGLGMEVSHLPETAQSANGTYVIPYPVRTATFQGDWFTVAEEYRNWADGQPYARKSRLSRHLVPRWVLDTDLWVWNRGKSEDVVDPAIFLGEYSGLNVSVFWHWWHGCAYDVGFPDYFPPREGEESFRASLERAHQANVRAMVYLNQRLWGMTTSSWTARAAERFAVKQPDGTVRREIYNVFTQSPCASMCMGTAFWRDTYASLAERAVLGFGVDGIYMDQACSNLACYDPSHGHAIGGGTYWVNGFRLLQQDIRDRCASRGAVALAGEGCGEAWLPYLDMMLSLQVSRERYAAPSDWEPIPFFHAVYHERAVLFGNYASLTMPPYDELWPKETAPRDPLALLDRSFSRQFRLEQARAWVWGQQPTVANFFPRLLRERAEEMEFVLSLARLRRWGRKYFLHGTMLRPPLLEVPSEEIDISRVSIYAGRDGVLARYTKAFPTVWASGWRSPEGDVGVAIANVSASPQTFELVLDKQHYPISRFHRLRVVREDGLSCTVAENRAPRVIHVMVNLNPFEVCVYDWTKTGSVRDKVD